MALSGGSVKAILNFVVIELLFVLLGGGVFWLCFVIIDKLAPYDLRAEIVEKKDLALAVVAGSMCIAIGLIVSADVHG